MKKSYIIFLLLGLGVLVAAIITAGASIPLFLNIPALIVVLFLPTFVVIGVFGLRTFFRSFNLSESTSNTTKEELDTGASLFSMFSRCLLLTGFITTMIGFIAILGNLQSAQEIGKAVALALITLFYSFILVLLVTLPYTYAYKRRLSELNAG
jgi:flagellar motor component MotA